MLSEEVCCCPGGVSPCIVLLEDVVSMTTKVRYNEGSEDLIDVAGRRHTISSTSTDILKDHRSQFVV